MQKINGKIIKGKSIKGDRTTVRTKTKTEIEESERSREGLMEEEGKRERDWKYK